jgi:hypothetical protein
MAPSHSKPTERHARELQLSREDLEAAGSEPLSQKRSIHHYQTDSTKYSQLRRVLNFWKSKVQTSTSLKRNNASNRVQIASMIFLLLKAQISITHLPLTRSLRTTMR